MRKIIVLIFICCIFAIAILKAEQNPHEKNINIYALTQANMLSKAVKDALYRVYVPNGNEGTVSVIDPTTYQVVDTFHTGKNPQHVVPAYDLQTLWVLNDKGNSLTPINPTTGKPGANVAVDDPYNLYFTPDGQFAIVVCEARKQLQFRDPKTMALHDVVPLHCSGANHMEFTPDGRYAIFTCEFSGQLAKLDLSNHQIVGYLSLNLAPMPAPIADADSLSFNNTPFPQTSPFLENNQQMITISGTGNGLVIDNTKSQPSDVLTASIQYQSMQEQKSMPQDIRSTADGQTFLVADMMQDGVILIDPINFIQTGFIPTGVGTHAIYPSRDGKLFYVSNRGCHHTACKAHGPGGVSVLDAEKRKVIATWPIPGGGSPDMGNVSADGKELWLSGRYDNEVYVFNTISGALSHRIRVGKGPHGLTVWPQPGQFSLGHTGNMR